MVVQSRFLVIFVKKTQSQFLDKNELFLRTRSIGKRKIGVEHPLGKVLKSGAGIFKNVIIWPKMAVDLSVAILRQNVYFENLNIN